MTDVRSVLGGLGADQVQVAKTLDWAGVTGRRHSTTKCPVANYLRLYYPDSFDVVVTPDRVCIWEEQDSLPTLSHDVPTPQCVRDFVSSFDSGKHPRLDDQQNHDVEAIRFETLLHPDLVIERAILRVPA